MEMTLLSWEKPRNKRAAHAAADKKKNHLHLFAVINLPKPPSVQPPVCFAKAASAPLKMSGSLTLMQSRKIQRT
eukprot:UN28211